MMIRHLLLDSIERYPDDGIVPIFVMLKDYDVNSESLFDYLLNGPQVNVQLEIMNPADFDFGEPPSEIL